MLQNLVSTLAPWVFVGAYMFPSILAGLRHHRQTGAIATLNALLGWTVLVWIICLVWAMIRPAPTPVAR